MTNEILSSIERFGATGEQLVDLDSPGPRALRFADLVRAPEAGRAPVVVETQGYPLVYIFDGRREVAPQALHRWVRRIAFRGDADWVGVLRPGRLDIHPAVLDEKAAPKPAEGLPEGILRIPALLHRPGIDGTSVRLRLKRLLFESIKEAREEFDLTPRDALALVGGALFWRFLVDRKLLDGLDPSTIAPRAESWTDCLDTKQNALATFRWMDRTFNGGLLKFDTPRQNFPAELFRRVAGDIVHKTDARGQLSLPEKWAQIDFAHVPVGLLSEVYEAVGHDLDREKATRQSLFYTPRHLAEFMVDEVLDSLRDVERPCVLDPAAGAGVFLVAALRALVAREWERTGLRPARRIIRRILNEQLVGFDIDGDALRLAELALYLTAIELDPEERPRPLDVLRFEALRGHVLLEQGDSEGLGSLRPIREEDRGRFDAVIGNPPWTASKSKNIKRSWADGSRSIIEARLGKDRAAKFKFPDANPDVPFVYRAMEWAKPGGIIGLLMHARWLFAQSKPAIEARRDLLESVHVTGILNAAALRRTRVWPKMSTPFCILFGANEAPPERAAFQFVSPELDTEDTSQDRIRIDWRDAKVVEVEEVIKRPWRLKSLFRGTNIDDAIVRDICNRGIRLKEYLGSLGTKLANGYQVAASGRAKPPPAEMRRLGDLRDTELEFVVDTERLEKFAHEKLLFSRDPAIYRAPLLIVHESMVVDRCRPRAGLALRDVAYDERFDGVSFAGVDQWLEVASYLQLVLQSSVLIHALLMLDGQFGVERDVVHLETLNRFPVVPWRDLGTDVRRDLLALSKEMKRGLDRDLLGKIDRLVGGRVYGLTAVQQQAISDTLATGLTTTESQSEAVRPTTSTERRLFASVCERSLRDILKASLSTAHVRVRQDLPREIWRFVQIDRGSEGESRPDVVDLPSLDFLREADEGAASLVTLRIDCRTTLVGILDRYRYWTATRARLLATTLIAETQG